MTEILLALIAQLNGSIFTLIVVLIVIFWLLYKAGKMTESFSSFSKKGVKMDNNIDLIKDDIAKIKATTDLLYSAYLQTVKAGSPLKLTTKGEEIEKAISIKSKVTSHWEEIIKKLDPSITSNNLYDIQTTSMNFAQYCVENIFTQEEQNEIKNYAFKTGTNLLEIYPIVGIQIRDKVFIEHGIDINKLG